MERIGIVLALSVLVGCQTGVAPGATCAHASDCAAPLTCAVGRCRVECRANADCGAGRVCLLDSAGAGACSLAQDTCTDTCGFGLACVGARCVTPCTSDGQCPIDGRCDAGGCAPGPIRDAGAGGDAAVVITRCMSDRDCAADQACWLNASAGARAVPVCRPRCASDAECATGTRCIHASRTDGGYEDVCSMPCDPALDTGCPAGTTCGLDYHGTAGADVIVAVCRIPADVAEGCSCMHGLTGDCAAGLTCRTEATDICSRMCVIGSQCAGGGPCMRGNPTWLVGSTDYGSCSAPACP